MKKVLSLVLMAVLCISLVAGCSSGNTASSAVQDVPASSDAATSTESSVSSEETAGTSDPTETPTQATGEAATVYFTEQITPEALISIYEALGREATGKVGIKLHMGEPGGNYYLSPDLIKDFVQLVNGTIVESNTGGGMGARGTTAMHMQVAEDHGFTAIAPVQILDADGEIGLPIQNGKHLEEDIVGAAFADYDFHVVLSHFKGHLMGGFGGALKNMSIGYASSNGKVLIHTAGASTTSFTPAEQDDFLESMAEAAKAVADAGDGNMIYISVMNNLSVDCDCDDSPAVPELHDIGILASLDPVALDKACVDLIYQADDVDSTSLRERIESKNGTHILDYAAEIGLGSLEYELVSIDA